MRAFSALLLAVVFFVQVQAAELSAPQSDKLDALPVLHQGRIKPFAVAADEMLLTVAFTARLAKDQSPTELAQAIMADPSAWADRPLVYVPWLPLRKDLALPEAEQRASLHQVESLRARLEGAVAKRQRIDQTGIIEPWSADEAALVTLANRYGEALEMVGGRSLRLTPLAISDDERRWLLTVVAPRLLLASQSPQNNSIERPWQTQLRELVATQPDQAARLKDADIWLTWEDLVRSPDPLLREAPAGLAAVMRAPLNADSLRIRGLARDADLGRHAYPSAGLISAELIYIRARPFTIAWIGFLAGGLAVAFGLGGAGGLGGTGGLGGSQATHARRWWRRIGLALTTIAIIATVAGLAVRTVITGLGAVTNLYETLIYVGLIVAILGLFFTRLSGKGIYAVAGGIGAALCAMIGEAMPPDLGQHIGQLQPVLRSKFWLWIHVKTVVGAYAPLVLALVLGNVVMWQAWRQKRAVSVDESRSLYRCLQWGTVLMAAGTLLGAVWADQAWGRFWGWDPKEVGALLIVLTYLIPLHLRYVGVVGPTGLAAWSVLGFLSVVWSWYGVNFILGAGLHAYAFGNGGQAIVLPLAAAQTILTIWQLIAIRRAGRVVTTTAPAI